MIAAKAETLGIWNALPANDRSRALAADRFVDFPNDPQDNAWRKRTSEAIQSGKTDPTKAKAWPAFVKSLGALEIHARLQSRLMVNMASGVFENGNLALDRISGVPYIPGSAVKGCARRFAIHALTEAPATEKLTHLQDIAAVFGWGDQDWKSGRNRNGEFYSDFEPSCGTEWEACRAHFKDRPAQNTGQIAFLPAFPYEGDPGIALDVVTCHHSKYYSDSLPSAIATDTEEPNPIIFPAVSAAKNPLFLFGIHPLRTTDASLLEKAAYWLSQGLELFGLGAKTNAGYGWFSCLTPQEVEEMTARRQQTASDYHNEATFQNAVLALLNKPQEYQKLQLEIPKLQKSDNAHWLEKLRSRLASPEGKDARKRLKDKDWFPKEWLPQL
jgi:CRISPR type III-B/RAMP module RAMP protein Cmr6